MALVGCPNCPSEDINALLCDDNRSRWRRLCSCERACRRRCSRCVIDADCVVFHGHAAGPLPILPSDSTESVQFLCFRHNHVAPAKPLPPDVPQPLLQPTGLGGLPGPPPRALPDNFPRNMHHLMHHEVECSHCGDVHHLSRRHTFCGSDSCCPKCNSVVHDMVNRQDCCPCGYCSQGRIHGFHRRVPASPETF